MPCDNCDKIFTSIIELNKHKEDHDKDQQPFENNPLNTTNESMKVNVVMKSDPLDTTAADVSEAMKDTDSMKSIEESKEIDDTKFKDKGFEDQDGSEFIERKVKSILCKHCSKSFPRMYEYRKHLIMHEEKPFCCKICDKLFASETLLNSHVRFHSKGKPFQCKICHKRFSMPSHLKKHEIIHTDERPYECSICQKSYRQKQKLKVHSWIHSGESPFQCKICSKQFSRSDNLRAHQSNKTCTPIEENENGIRLYKGKDPLVKSLLCQYCGKNFTRPHLLERHLTIHKEKDSPKSNDLASDCGLDSNKMKSLLCQYCGKSFDSRFGFEKHLTMHKEKPFSCKDCGKLFALESNLKSHEKYHNKLLPFQCQTCLRAFSFLSDFKRHEITHTDERPYQCLICQKKFKLKMQLRVHTWYHTGDTPLKCDICSKKFYRKDTLKQHKKNNVCNEQPSQNENLKNPENFAEPENTNTDKTVEDSTLSVVDPKVGSNCQPKLTYLQLIAEALLHAKDEKLKSSEIFHAIASRHPFYKIKEKERKWQTSIRRTLSENKGILFDLLDQNDAEFCKINKISRKGGLWKLLPEGKAIFEKEIKADFVEPRKD